MSKKEEFEKPEKETGLESQEIAEKAIERKAENSLSMKEISEIHTEDAAGKAEAREQLEVMELSELIREMEEELEILTTGSDEWEGMAYEPVSVWDKMFNRKKIAEKEKAKERAREINDVRRGMMDEFDRLRLELYARSRENLKDEPELLKEFVEDESHRRGSDLFATKQEKEFQQSNAEQAAENLEKHPQYRREWLVKMEETDVDWDPPKWKIDLLLKPAMEGGDEFAKRDALDFISASRTMFPERLERQYMKLLNDDNSRVRNQAQEILEQKQQVSTESARLLSE